MEQISYVEANSHSANQQMSRLLWNPERSLPHSQGPATGPYPEPDESSSHLLTQFT